MNDKVTQREAKTAEGKKHSSWFKIHWKIMDENTYYKNAQFISTV